MAEIDALLQRMSAVGASDLHLKVGVAPRFRIVGELEEIGGSDPLSRESIERMMLEILTDEQRQQFKERRELDFAHGRPQHGRFRCNYFEDFWGPAAVFRRIPEQIPSLEQLGLPAAIGHFAHLRRGLVLVTGASGSGKTSTVAALIDLINENYCKHVITLEDPIEYLHAPKMSIIHQRGVGYDITDFSSGIVAALRQDPNVLLIGEMRDLETIRMAVSAAEVGVLVFATLHTNSAAESVDRIVDVFPPSEQPQIRTQLSLSLAGVVSQALLRRCDQPGRIPATEVLIATHATCNLIREGKTQDITTVMQSGKARGMHTLDDSLETLLRKRLIDPQEAFAHAQNKTRFEHYLKRDKVRAPRPMLR